MKPFVRRFGYLFALLAVGALIALLLRPAKVPVETGRAARGPLLATLDEEGETRIRDRHTVAAPVSGRLAPIALREGDEVRRGAVVAVLRPAPLDSRGRQVAEAAVRAAEDARTAAQAQLAEASAALAQLRLTLSRNERLATAGQLAPEALDQARTAARTQTQVVAAARSRVEVARHELERARAALVAAGPEEESARTTVVRAPAAGRVLRLIERSERVVAAGSPLLEIGDPGDLEVVVDVLSTDAVTIPPGAPMVLDVGGGRTLRGRVRRVEPAAFTKVSPLGVEEQRVNVVGDLLDRRPEVGDRFRVAARIVLWQAESVLKVPSGAVFRRDAGWGVFVVESGRARLRAVRVGHRNADEVEVTSGLAPGEAVVLYPSDQVQDGGRVATR